VTYLPPGARAALAPPVRPGIQRRYVPSCPAAAPVAGARVEAAADRVGDGESDGAEHEAQGAG